MATELNRLIAMGGTQNKSPVQRYMETRAQVGQERQNKLAMESTRQNMAMQQQQNQRAQQQQQIVMDKAYSKDVYDLMKGVDAAQDINKDDEFKKRIPELNRLQQRYHKPVSDTETPWSQQGFDVLESEFGDLTGTPANVIYKGKLINAIKGPTGNYLDEKTRKPLYGAVKAPGRQETAQVSGFSPSDVSKKEFQQLDREEDIYKLTNNLDTLKSFIQSPDYLGGTTGDIVSAGNSFVQQMRQLTGLEDTGGQIPTADISVGARPEYSRLRRAAINNDRKSALVIELAYNIAKSFDRGGRVTDADFKFASRLISGSADVKSTLLTIDDFMDRSIKNYNASDTLFSERNKRKAHLFSQEKYQKMYNRKPKMQISDKDQEKNFRKSLYEDYGIQ